MDRRCERMLKKKKKRQSKCIRDYNRIHKKITSKLCIKKINLYMLFKYS